MDKMREDFEAWCCERGFTLKPAETNCGVLIDGEYGHQRVQLAWESWKASRAALCVELPEKMNPEVLSLWDIGFNEGIESVMDCMQEAGVTCK